MTLLENWEMMGRRLFTLAAKCLRGVGFKHFNRVVRLDFCQARIGQNLRCLIIDVAKYFAVSMNTRQAIIFWCLWKQPSDDVHLFLKKEDQEPFLEHFQKLSICLCLFLCHTINQTNVFFLFIFHRSLPDCFALILARKL